MSQAVTHQIHRIFTWSFVNDIKKLDWNSQQGHLIKKVVKIGLTILGISLAGLALANSFFWTVSLAAILATTTSVIILTDPALAQKIIEKFSNTPEEIVVQPDKNAQPDTVINSPTNNKPFVFASKPINKKPFTFSSE